MYFITLCSPQSDTSFIISQRNNKDSLSSFFFFFLTSMDIANNSVALLSLVFEGLQNIQLARRFEHDFAVYRIRLDVIQMRLSRWGEAAALINSNGSPQLKLTDDSNGIKRSADEEKQIYSILESIDDTIVKAQRNAKGIKDKITSRNTAVVDMAPGDGQVLHPDTCMPRDLKKIRTKLYEILQRRKMQAVKTIDSAKWAFYKQEQCDKFIQDMSSLIDDLEKLTPEEKLRELSNQELSGLSKSNLEDLQDIVKECDPWIQGAIEEELEHAPGSGGYNITLSKNDNNSGILTGINHGQATTTTNYYGRS